MNRSEDVRLVLSPLAKTWLLDFDGCVVRHNGHLAGGDQLLDGVAAFWRTLPPTDRVIVMSSRAEDHRRAMSDFLAAHGLRFDHMVLGLPHGERICVNDMKPSGLRTAVAVNVPRDAGLGLVSYVIDRSL